MATNKSSKAGANANRKGKAASAGSGTGSSRGAKGASVKKNGAKRTSAARGKVTPSPSGRAASNPLLSWAALGVAMLVCGVFLTVAFLTGRGALLGEGGLVAVRYLLGDAGLLLPPALAISGVLLILDRIDSRRIIGATLLFLGAAATLSAPMALDERLDPASFPEYGGILGSLVYAGVYGIAGVIGAALVLVVLYVAGLLLILGLTAQQGLVWFRGMISSSGSSAKNRLSDWRGRFSEHARTRRELRESGNEAEGLEPVTEKETSRKRDRSTHGAVEGDTMDLGNALYGAADGDETSVIERVDVGGDNRESHGSEDSADGFEVVLPESRKQTSFEEIDGNREPVSGDYSPPSMSLLKTGKGEPEHDAEQTSARLTQALRDLGVEAHVLRAIVGPRVTRYELRLGSGIKVSKVSNLQQDIAYALAATEVRILAPIPGKSAVGVEVPNTKPATVTLGDVFQEYPAGNDWALPVGLGKDISGKPVFLDLAEMPHLLVAGTTGSGKSVMLNNLLTSMILTTDPRQVKLVLIDPKRVELTQFARIPHLITPVVTDVKKASNALSWAVAEMERRYEVLEKHGARSLDGYNERFEQQMPYIVVVIDELADLMMAAASKVEDAVIRLAQKARAVGIHLVVATQRPSVDVITGMIKANIPSRIAFAVSSQVDSRVILDTSGAEALLGSGDMLFKPVTSLRSSRVQGAYITESEVDEIVSASTESAQARYVEEVTEGTPDHRGSTEEPEDDLLPDAASFVVTNEQASVSAVQRRFRVGYSRAGRIVDSLERKGVVGPYEGSKARSIMVTEMELGQIFSSSGEAGGSEAGEETKPKDSLPEPPTPLHGGAGNSFSRSRLGSLKGSTVEESQELQDSQEPQEAPASRAEEDSDDLESGSHR